MWKNIRFLKPYVPEFHWHLKPLQKGPPIHLNYAVKLQYRHSGLSGILRFLRLPPLLCLPSSESGLQLILLPVPVLKSAVLFPLPVPV